MIPRWFLAGLVLALPVLIVTFAVVMGASALAGGLGDAAGSRGLFWFAIAALILLIINILLLLAVLGIRAVNESREREEP